MASSLDQILQEIRCLLGEADEFYSGPSIDDSKDYYHSNQIRAHADALRLGAEAHQKSNGGSLKEKIQAHIKAAKAHREAAKQLGTFGGSREHLRAADMHIGAAKELKRLAK